MNSEEVFDSIAIRSLSKEVKHNISFLLDLIHCSFPLDYWCYASDGHLIRSTSEQSRILDVFFTIGNVKEYMVAYGSEQTMPIILSSTLGNLWIAILDKTDTSQGQYHVLGPVFTDNISSQALENRVNTYNIPLSWKRQFINLVNHFPAIPWTTLAQFTIMLHYTVTGERISVADFAYQKNVDSHEKTLTHSTNKSDVTDNISSRSKSLDENHVLPWMAEQALLSNIREGNLNYHTALSNAAAMSSGVKINTGDPTRRAKDSGIVFSALCARAAIDGGISSEAAYTIQNMYSQSIESANNSSEIAAINHQMYQDFIERVHRIHELPNVTTQIRSCIEYIELHCMENISISTLANLSGYTDYYLSRKFKEETGTSIKQFIRYQKIKAARNLLTTTDLSIQEISDKLDFCSRSYFTDIFTKSEGITPTDFRIKHKKI